MSTRSQIARLMGDGVPAPEIARRLGLASPTVDYHLRRLAESPVALDPPRPSTGTGRTQVSTRDDVARLLARGVSAAAIARELRVSWHAAKQHGAVVARPQRIPLD